MSGCRFRTEGAEEDKGFRTFSADLPIPIYQKLRIWLFSSGSFAAEISFDTAYGNWRLDTRIEYWLQSDDPTVNRPLPQAVLTLYDGLVICITGTKDTTYRAH